MTFIVVAGVAVWAMSKMRVGSSAPRRRRRRFGGRKGGASFSSAPAPAYSPPALSSSGVAA